jgi:cytochrome c oxidase subunit 4
MSMHSGSHHPNYVKVYVWLMALMLASLGVSVSPVPAGLAATMIFGMALAKALLVALYFMHLRFEQIALAAALLVPLLLAATLFIVLIPEFGA